MAIAWLLGDNLEGGSTDLNTAASATALEYNISHYFDDDYYIFDEGQPTKLIFAKTGDYLISAGLPMTSNHVNTTNRNDICQEIRLNGSLIPGGYSDSSYIRNTGGAYESSNRSTTVALNVDAGDYIEHYVYRGSTETTNVVTDDGHTLYVEYVESGHKDMFIARATQTTGSTDMNQAIAYPLEWSIEDRVDDGYTHNAANSPENITLKQASAYLVFCNIPLSTSAVRGNITGRVLVDGVMVDGGMFQQGMVRNADGIDTGSCHFAGMVQTTSPGQILTVTTERETTVYGAVTVGSYYANIIVKRIREDTGIYQSNATQVAGSTNWNPSSKSTVDWATDNLLDTEYFSHSTATNSDEITVSKAGDYFLTFNVALQGSVARAAPKATVQVNGIDVPGLQAKSAYIRASGSSDSSSNTMVGLMPGVQAGDVITVSMEGIGGAGTIDAQTPATLMIRGKNLPIALTFWFGA